MNIVATVFADFVEANPGGPSQLRTEVAGQSILTHTLQRLMRVSGLAGRCLVVRQRDHEPAAQTLHATGLNDKIDLLPLDTGVRPRRQLTRAARRWSLESWRGSLLGLTWYDEFVDPPTAARVLNHYRCDGVFCFDGHQPVFDPALATAMLAHAEENSQEAKMVFTQAPPGLAGILLRRESLADLLELNVPLGLALSYRPEIAQADPITHSACYHVAPEVAQTAARLTGDTRRSRELLAAALQDLGQDASAAALCAWANAPGHGRAGPLPIEVELELTTDDPLPKTTLRPRGSRVPRRQLDDIGPVARLAQQLAAYDDRLVLLGGHGDPLRHPRFAEVCRLLRSSGVFGVGVVTPLLELTDESFEALFDSPVDVVEVLVDAHSAATYQRVHQHDGYDRVLANIARIEQARAQRLAPQPIVACSLTRCAATIQEMEGFFDDCIRKYGSALIRGYNDYCGSLPADTLLPTVPWVREPCRRLATRLMLLADGSAVACGQDFRGELRVGDWTRESLDEIWGGMALAGIRQRHATLSLGALPLCQRCSEWFRP